MQTILGPGIRVRQSSLGARNLLSRNILQDRAMISPCKWTIGCFAPILGNRLCSANVRFPPTASVSLYAQGRTFGIADVTSTSRSILPATSPSRTLSSARHQSSYPHRAEAICSGCGRQVTGQASTSTRRQRPRCRTRSMPTTTVVDRTGPVPVSVRSGFHVKRPCGRRPLGFSSPRLSVGGAGCRSH